MSQAAVGWVEHGDFSCETQLPEKCYQMLLRIWEAVDWVEHGDFPCETQLPEKCYRMLLRIWAAVGWVERGDFPCETQQLLTVVGRKLEQRYNVCFNRRRERFSI